MIPNQFQSSSFSPKDDSQWKLLYDFLQMRLIFGPPHKFAYLRTLARTRKYTRTVYPPGWKFM